MQQHMGSLAPRATRLSPRLRSAGGGSLLSSGRGHRVVLAGWARLGRVTARVVAAPESCLLQDAEITTCKPSSLLDQGADQAINASNQLTTIRNKDKFFQVEMTVRDDDLDEYGVVNNAIYVSYIHTGRDVLLEYLGISVEYWASTGNAMALSELNLKYFAPLRSGDRFVIKVRPVQIKGVRMVIHHLIETLPDRKPVLEARGTVVFLNKDYRPTRVFPEVSAKAWEMFACKEG
ncbi:acyl-acyl carrier protein thioesterase TE3, chloroplastic-like [Phragmites australis]|uniref:acyl-acyl carrier protein thioesterase TE3, chloroplastic-like n=1 Tax=Phragmites australis TaxID=29695 RepID=UPI002D788820|nr:acyl-acyl carrier protein thioesterase TE3, chloroplastic-like [Phragmites australis]